MAQQTFDRSAEDIGNIVGLEHVNLKVPNQEPATDFYLGGLGLTRDPYMMAGTNNMWVNVGRSQFHLPKGDPNVLRGHIGLVVPSLDDLCERLNTVKPRLEGSKFDCKRHNAFVEATCPWGNRFRLYEPDAETFGPVNLGMPYVEFDVPEGTADGIARFYSGIMGTHASVAENDNGRCARVPMGVGQEVLFRETDRPIPEYDGHHIQIYVADFSGPYRKLQERGLIFEESNRYQYRFKDIVDPESGKLLFTVEHEVRSMTSPMFLRPLVNRNPDQNIMQYAPGHDAWIPGAAYEE